MKQNYNKPQKVAFMVIGKYFTKAFFLTILPSALILVLYYTLIHTPQSDEAKKQIKSLKEQNEVLKKQNDSILKSIVQQQEDINRSEEIIGELNEQKEQLYQNLDSVNKKIQKNQTQYDHANRHADNYSSNDIRRYFSNLQ